jgi:hypothetical protein
MFKILRKSITIDIFYISKVQNHGIYDRVEGEGRGSGKRR